LIVGATIPYLSVLALSSGANACAYASSEQCVSYFVNVFGENATGGDYTLPYTYHVFPIAASIDASLLVLRAILLTCLDFDYMLYATIAAGISYIPAICVVKFAGVSFQKQAVGFFSAMYVPQFVLVCAFSIRLYFIIKKLSNGEEGPWSKERRVSSMTAIKDKTAAIDIGAKAINAAEAEAKANANAANYNGDDDPSKHSENSC